MPVIELPELSLVVLIGPSGSGKSSFARKHFKPTEVISSDYCRGLVADDENDQSATADAFDVLHYIVGKRLKTGLLTVIDATNVRPEDRKCYVQLAREYHCLPVAIVLDLPERLCQERNEHRVDREFGPHVIRSQRAVMRRGLGRGAKKLKREGFRHRWILESEEQVDAIKIERKPLWNNKKHEHGPFDIVGDVHGCFDELIALLEKLGYGLEKDQGANEGDWSVLSPAHEPTRKLLFLGDLVDRGPKSPAVLRLVMRACAEGRALCVPGNHDDKLKRKLMGKQVQVKHGLAETLEQLEPEPESFLEAVREFLDGLVSHYVLDDGKLVIAHAGLTESMQGRGSGKVRAFCLYGETTGETDEFGLPVRHNWAAEYRGPATVIYGHTPVPRADWLNGTLCIDTGCVFGGKLTALRYPEQTLASVEANATYAEPARPFLEDTFANEGARSVQQQHDDMLHLEDVTGKRIIDTRLQRNITIREGNAAAALEVMTRFAADPRWLIYLPPTMSPCETSRLDNYLEHPIEAFDYYRSRGVTEVVCEEKHMGSRAVVIVCQDEDAAARRFGITTGEVGVVYTRTGRRFFNDETIEKSFLERVRKAIDWAGLWDEFDTTWVCLDCELMPWSAKAQALLQDQYAAVGSAAKAAMSAVVPELTQAVDRLDDASMTGLLDRYVARQTAVERYINAYQQYCWPVVTLDDLKLAPFHLLATEHAVHSDRDHLWHMEVLARLGQQDDLIVATQHCKVSLLHGNGGGDGDADGSGNGDREADDGGDNEEVQKAIAWWEKLTAAGGEGMVVKPLQFIQEGNRGLLQPAVKCRGSEYLRIIYGPEYLMPEHLERLRQRGLKHKRSMAVREFALGVESLERFVQREPLRRVHECVFGVLALESEPVDPRL